MAPTSLGPGGYQEPIKRERWNFRRIFAAEQHLEGRYSSDITLVNRPQIDHWADPLVGVDCEAKERALADAGQQSLSLAVYCDVEGLLPTQVRNKPEMLASFQNLLASKLGIELSWPVWARGAVR